MYTEYACYDETNQDIVQAKVFTALSCGVQGISVPSILLGKIAPSIPHGITLSCPIDWPLGASSVSIRNHSVISSIHQGATAIDLVSNRILYANNFDDYLLDLESNIKICEDNNVTLRVMIRYRHLENDEFANVCRTLQKLGVEYVLPATGYEVDNWTDNMLICGSIQKAFGIGCITNGSIFLDKHYEAIKKAGIYGMRLKNINSVNRLLTGV